MTVAVSFVQNAGVAFARLAAPTPNGFTNFTTPWPAGLLSDPSKKPCLIMAFSLMAFSEFGTPIVSATYGGIPCQTYLVRIGRNNVYTADNCRFTVVMALPGFDASKAASNVISVNIAGSAGQAYSTTIGYDAVATIAENVDPNFNLATAISRTFADSATAPYLLTLPAPNTSNPAVNVPAGGMLVSLYNTATSTVPATLGMTFPVGSTTELYPPGQQAVQPGYYSPGGALYATVKWTDPVSSYNQTAFVVAFALPPVPSASATVNCDCTDTTGYDTLATLRNRLMIRLGYAAQVSNPPPGMSALLTEFLQSAQKEMYRKYAALRTKRLFRWTMTPGTVMYGLRSNDEDTVCNLKLDPYKEIEWVGIQQQGNSSWTPMTEGIPPEFYTSANNVGIPTNYEIRQCIEVFPPPNAAHYLWIKGHMGLQAFSADTDTPTIDPELVFLRALATGKAHYGKVDAAATAQMANSYLLQLVAGTHGRKRYIPTVELPGPATQPLLVLKAGQ